MQHLAESLENTYAEPDGFSGLPLFGFEVIVEALGVTIAAAKDCCGSLRNPCYQIRRHLQEDAIPRGMLRRHHDVLMPSPYFADLTHAMDDVRQIYSLDRIAGPELCFKF
jgi:hypothetical protein